MAKYDYGGGCPCGLYAECEPNCESKGITMNEEDDFGFSFADEKELVKPDTKKLEELRTMIMPLLTNLKKNPEKDIIKWEGKDRVKKIDAFIKKMNKLIDE